MPGIVIGETSSGTNPLLPFFYQTGGILTDIYALSFKVFSLETGLQVHTDTINTDLVADGGDKIATGYYAAPLDPSNLGLTAGAYELEWTYQVADGDPQLKAIYAFEVLSSKFRTGMRYSAYASSDLSQLSSFPIEDRQKALNTVSREIDRLTGRFFFPRYMRIDVSVRPESAVLWLDQPIIGIGSVVLEYAGVVSDTLTSEDIQLANLRIFNRHLGYVLTPDDRDNPKIEFAQVGSTTNLAEYSHFPAGTKNVQITGVFGFTDPDGSPFGCVPDPLQEVAKTLVYKKLIDPIGIDPFSQGQGRVKKAKTRDQEIQFDTTLSKDATMTGDLKLDTILADYSRPPHVGVAG